LIGSRIRSRRATETDTKALGLDQNYEWLESERPSVRRRPGAWREHLPAGLTRPAAGDL